MATLYLGKEKVKLIIGKDICNLYVPNSTNTIVSNSLKSSDNYTLKSSDGLILVPKEAN